MNDTFRLSDAAFVVAGRLVSDCGPVYFFQQELPQATIGFAYNYRGDGCWHYLIKAGVWHEGSAFSSDLGTARVLLMVFSATAHRSLASASAQMIARYAPAELVGFAKELNPHARIPVCVMTGTLATDVHRPDAVQHTSTVVPLFGRKAG